MATSSTASGHASDAPAGAVEPPARPARRWRRVGLLFIILAVVLAIIASGWWLTRPPSESTDDAFIDADIRHVATEVPGRISTVLVEDNAMVRRGQLLAVLDDASAQAELEGARSAARQAEADLRAARSQSAVAAADYDQARALSQAGDTEAGAATRELERNEGLRRANALAVTDQQLDTAATAARLARARLSGLHEQVRAARARETSSEDQIGSFEAKLASARAEVHRAELGVRYRRVYAPADGYVVRRTALAGSYVEAGQDLLQIVPTDIFVTANFKETQVTHIRIGQPVDIRIDAFAGHHFRGQVESIQRGAGQAFTILPAENATGNFIKVIQRVPVKIRFLTIDRTFPLGPGLSVVPTVYTDR
jgi:membrane fusion protein (multidrug efflux system)